jgi:hypothetical protein
MRLVSACTAACLLQFAAAATPNTAAYYLIPREYGKPPQGPYSLKQLKEWHARGSLPQGKTVPMVDRILHK